MKITIFDIGPHRWSIAVLPSNKTEAEKFITWMKNNYPDCLCKKVYYGLSSSKSCRFYLELRGTDYSFPTTFKLTWG